MKLIPIAMICYNKPAFKPFIAHLLKAEKMLPPSRFWRVIFFLQNLIFFHPYESINFYRAGLLKIAHIVTPLLIIEH